jgi:F5/8 type C domain
MLLSRILMVVCLALSGVDAVAAPKLAVFVESGGCKLYGTEVVVKRLREIAREGGVVWEGQCKRGLIEGRGVLREEGTQTRDGQVMKYVYFFSGSARQGLREGRWRRESFERAADSPRFYTAASTLEFHGGVAKGKPRLLKPGSLAELTPAFRKFVINAQQEAAPANTALRYTAPAPAAITAVDAAPPTRSPPAAAKSTAAPSITSSSHSERMDANGLLKTASAGWQSGGSPDYPEWLLVDFHVSREVRLIALKAQDNQQARAPQILRVESSEDGKQWLPQAASEIPCAPNTDEGWLNLGLLTVAKGRYLKIVILANCGAEDFVAIRGLRFK